MIFESDRIKATKVYPILEFFEYAHLPTFLADISERFCELALDTAMGSIADGIQGDPEIDEALRKLLEAKDCAVRSAVRRKNQV